MIKSDKGKVEMNGSSVILIAELAIILKSAREHLGDCAVDFAVKSSKKSTEELRKEAEGMRAATNFLKAIFDKEDK